MEIASVDTLKEELKQLPPKQILSLLLRLARFKKENKELLSYLLFEAHDVQGYIEQAKNDIEEAFSELQQSQGYLYKKGFRKIQRLLNKRNKYMGNKMATIELYIFMAEKIKEQKRSIFTRSFLDKSLQQYIAKTQKLLPSIDDDLARDTERQIEALLSK
ncbi:MAG: hypothetical protein J7497_08000 [Chitinophagaceae bacterium]|nr:hypothetical protein [Chitinophagaceae bacterium]